MRSITELLGMRDEQEVKEFNELRDANDLIDAETPEEELPVWQSQATSVTAGERSYCERYAR